MRRLITAGGIAIIVGLLAGCEAPEEEPEPAPAVALEDQQAEPAGDEEEQDQAPPMRDLTSVDDDELGQRPDGVALAPGEEFEAVSVENAQGESVDLHELAAEHPLLVFFYRGGWCPFCNTQIRDLTLANEGFSSHGVLPVAISVDQMGEAARTQEAYEIPFPVLADPDLKAHEAFQVIYEADDEEVERLASMGIDLEASSGREHNSFAVPAVFLVSQGGEILWSHADLDYRKRPTPQQLLTVIQDVLGE